MPLYGHLPGGGTAPATVVRSREDTWDGRDVRVGDAVVRVRGPVPRCAAVNRHPDHGDTDLRALHLIRAYRPPLPSGKSLYFGVYADVVTPGTIRIGDPLATW